MITFKGIHFPKEAILYAVYFNLRYTISHRDLEEIMAERGVKVDHATLNRWVIKYAPLVAVKAQSKKGATRRSWRMDETYIKVRGKWLYLYRAVDKAENSLDFMLSERWNGPAATKFFAKALSSNGIPEKIVIDKSGANAVGIRETNKLLKRFGCPTKVETIKSKFLNNIFKQDHRFIKRLIWHMCGFKSFSTAAATLDGIEVASMIRKCQFPERDLSGFQ